MEPNLMILQKALRYLSSFLSLFAGILIFRNQNLQSHPYKVFAILMIIDAGNFLQFNLAQEIIDFPNVPILGYTLFQSETWIKSNENTYSMLSLLYCTNSLTTKLF